MKVLEDNGFVLTKEAADYQMQRLDEKYLKKQAADKKSENHKPPKVTFEGSYSRITAML